MGWLRDFREYRELRASGLANPDSRFKEALGASSSFSGERVTVDTALELGPVRSAVEQIAEAVGGLPFKVYRVLDGDERVEARGHRTWKLLHDKPNEHCTARRFWSATAAQLLVYGNSFIFKERGELGDVESLYHLDPTQVKVELDERMQKTFVVEGPPRKEYSSDEVLHIVGFSLDGYYGSSRITQARQTLGTAIARAKFEGGFYKRGARNPAVIEHPGRLGEKGIANLKQQFEIWHAGVENMHKIPVLEEGATMKAIGQSLEDMQFAEMSDQTRAEVATLFNMPASYLNAKTGDSLTYATQASNEIQLFRMAVLPLTDTIAKAVSADPALLPWDVMYAEFTYEAVMRADPMTQIQFFQIAKDVLGLDPEYIASRLNIPHDALDEPQAPVVVPTNGSAPDPQNQLVVKAAAQ